MPAGGNLARCNGIISDYFYNGHQVTASNSQFSVKKHTAQDME